MRLGRWSTTASNNNQSVPDGAPEGWSPPEVNNWARETMAAVRSWYAELEYLDLISTPAGSWPTIVRDSDTQVTIQGTDFTGTMTANRRVRVVGATTVEGHITSSALNGSDTEVVIDFDGSGVAPTSPTEVWVGPKGLGTAAWKDEGAGSGLDADTVDGQHATALSSNTGKSKVVNGRMQVWQRGTSFSDPADEYTADRFKSSVGGSGAGTVSRQAFTPGQTDVPGEPEFFLRHNQTMNGTNPYLLTRVEGVRTFAGQEVTWSFYAKAGGSENVTAEINQNFGSGGSSENQVTTSALALTTSWQRFTVTATLDSISGATIGSANYLELKLELPSGGSFTIDTADWQLELGASASDIDQRTFSDELSFCQRYFAKTFPYATSPASSAGLEGSLAQSVDNATGDNLAASWQYPVEMRATPSVTRYNPTASGTGWAGGFSGSASIPSSVLANATSGLIITGTNATAARSWFIHASADAEL